MEIGGGVLYSGRRSPFWLHARLSPTTVLYVVALTALGAAIGGVGPALKVTRGIGTRLREARSLGFGGLWTIVKGEG